MSHTRWARFREVLRNKNGDAAMFLGTKLTVTMAVGLVVMTVAYFSLGDAAKSSGGSVLAGVLGIGTVLLGVLVWGLVTRRPVPHVAWLAIIASIVPLLVSVYSGGAMWILAGALIAAAPTLLGLIWGHPAPGGPALADGTADPDVTTP